MVEAQELQVEGRLVVLSGEPAETLAAMRGSCRDVIVADDLSDERMGGVEGLLVSGTLDPAIVARAIQRVVAAHGLRLFLDLRGQAPDLGAASGLRIETVGLLGALPVVVLSTRGEREFGDLERLWADVVRLDRSGPVTESETILRLRDRVADLRRVSARKSERIAGQRDKLAQARARVAKEKAARERAERRRTELERSRGVRLARGARSFLNRIGGRRAALAVALVVGLTVLALVGWMATRGAAGGAVLAVLAVLGAVAAVGIVLLEVRRQGAAMRREVAGSREALDRFATRHRVFIDEAREQLEAVVDDSGNLRASLLRLESGQARTAAAVVAWERGLAADVGRRSIDAADQLAQTQAAIHLFSMIPVEGRVPAMGGWAASPDLVELVIDELLSRRPRVVVECGSGVSTLWFALAIRQFGLDCRVVALEHHAGFAEQTRALLARHDVAHIAEVRLAPLVDVDTGDYAGRWYDPDVTSSLSDIGLLLVDGPPAATGVHARFPAVPVLRAAFADSVSVVLDDMIRNDEQEVARMWEEYLPGFTREDLRLQKRATVFRRG